MRTQIITNSALKARAYAGTYVVILAWDFIDNDSGRLKKLLGFAIERSEIHNGQAIEKYWMKGIKRFRDKDKGLKPGTPVPTSEHPVQSFQWGDYTAKSGRDYVFRIVPVYGSVKLTTLDDQNSIEIPITTESETGEIKTNNIQIPVHDIYFNRGVIGSQAYAREFDNRQPDRDNPNAEEMVWLSRGLFEGLTNFIGIADSEQFSLRAALYEFHYLPVALAFAKSGESGADVKIIYDAASSYRESSEETIRQAQLEEFATLIPRTVSEGIRHNKFIVLLKGDKPVGVWTGSTNISAGGIFGQSNVGHIVWDNQVAEAYLLYWENLSKNLTPRKMRPFNITISPIPAGLPDRNSITPVFSARDGDEELTTLKWYADLMASAKKIMCITFAFNIDKLFQEVIQQENDVLRYLVKNNDLSGENIGVDRDVIFAAGGNFSSDSLSNFALERDNPLNTNDYIHNKFMLVDPLSEDPIVISGSANFSRPSQRTNDENMLVIRGNTRVADIYFGEFMRTFDHHYARYIFTRLNGTKGNDPNAGYLKPDNSWTGSHFDKTSYKFKRRNYFLNG